MWTKSKNGEPVRPQEIEISGNYVILRRNYKLAAATAEEVEHYEYEEWQMTREQYEVYCNFEDVIREQSDALVELAGLIDEVL